MTRCSDLLALVQPLYRVDAWTGCPEEALEGLRRRFGPLPQVLEDFYRAAARTPALQKVQDRWVLPEDLQGAGWLPASEHLILLAENQSVCWAVIRREDLSQADPPVYTTQDWQSWALCAPSTSAFLAAALTYEAVFAQPFQPEAFFGLTEAERGVLDARLSRYPFALACWLGCRAVFYHNAPDNLVVVLEDPSAGDQQMLYGAGSEDSYGALLEVVDGLGEEI